MRVGRDWMTGTFEDASQICKYKRRHTYSVYSAIKPFRTANERILGRARCSSIHGDKWLGAFIAEEAQQHRRQGRVRHAHHWSCVYEIF